MKAIRSRSNDRVIVAPGTNSCVLCSANCVPFSAMLSSFQISEAIFSPSDSCGRVEAGRGVAGGGNVCQGFG